MALEYELATPFFKDPTSYNSLPPRYEVNPNSHKQTSVIYNDLNPINNHMFHINSLRANFFRVNINIYLHFMTFLHINKTQLVEIPPRVRQGPAYST